MSGLQGHLMMSLYPQILSYTIVFDSYFFWRLFLVFSAILEFLKLVKGVVNSIRAESMKSIWNVFGTVFKEIQIFKMINIHFCENFQKCLRLWKKIKSIISKNAAQGYFRLSSLVLIKCMFYPNCMTGPGIDYFSREVNFFVLCDFLACKAKFLKTR
jgi:hypothetical protein